jgi:hypothetical protein
MRTGLVLPYMLGLDVIAFSIRMSLLLFFFSLLIFQQKINKNFGKRCGIFYFFSFDSFSDIVCVFA